MNYGISKVLFIALFPDVICIFIVLIWSILTNNLNSYGNIFNNFGSFILFIGNTWAAVVFVCVGIYGLIQERRIRELEK
jgi:hypothetical protein